MVTITETSNKAEVITAALELADHQAEQINRLRQQQQALWAVVAVLSALVLL
jgi:hypothetical protein